MIIPSATSFRTGGRVELHGTEKIFIYSFKPIGNNRMDCSTKINGSHTNSLNFWLCDLTVLQVFVGFLSNLKNLPCRPPDCLEFIFCFQTIKTVTRIIMTFRKFYSLLLIFFDRYSAIRCSIDPSQLFMKCDRTMTCASLNYSGTPWTYELAAFKLWILGVDLDEKTNTDEKWFSLNLT